MFDFHEYLQEQKKAIYEKNGSLYNPTCRMGERMWAAFGEYVEISSPFSAPKDNEVIYYCGVLMKLDKRLKADNIQFKHEVVLQL